MSGEPRTTSRAQGPARLPKLALLWVMVCICGFAALSFPSFREKLLAVEYWTSDWRTALLSDRTAANHSRIAVVLFDPTSAPGRAYLPVPREYHARLIHTVSAAQPAIIGLDFYFLQETDLESDRVFKETIRTANTPIVIGAVTEKLKQFTAKQLAYQKQFLADVGRPGGDIALNFAEDSVTRRTYDASKNPEYPETFARRIARLAGAQVEGVPQELHVGWLWGARSNPYPFLTIAAQDLLSGQPGAFQLQEHLKGKIVLVGLNFPYFDQHRTPLSVATKEGMLGVMIHAQMIAQLLDNRIYSELGLRAMAGFLAGVILVGLTLGWIFWKHASLLGQGAAAVALVSLDAVLYYVWRIYLPLTPALYVWFLAVLGGSNFRVLVDWMKERRSAGREFAVQSA